MDAKELTDEQRKAIDKAALMLSIFGRHRRQENLREHFGEDWPRAARDLVSTLRAILAASHSDAAQAPLRTHTTQPGESVMGIALRQYGSEAKWRHVLACNPKFAHLLPNDYFPVGTVLTLPPSAAPVAPAAAEPNAESSTSICFFCGEPMSGKHEDDCPQAAQPDERADIDWLILEYGKACNECKSATAMDAARDRLKAAIDARATGPQATTSDEPDKWVAKVRVTHKGYGMELSKYIAYALPEGVHELYARAAVPQAGATLTDEFQRKILHAITQSKTTSHACDAVRALLGAQPPHTPIYQIGANAGGGIAWWDVDKDRYEREKKAGFMKTGIVYREAT